MSVGVLGRGLTFYLTRPGLEEWRETDRSSRTDCPKVGQHMNPQEDGCRFRCSCGRISSCCPYWIRCKKSWPKACSCALAANALPGICPLGLRHFRPCSSPWVDYWPGSCSARNTSFEISAADEDDSARQSRSFDGDHEPTQGFGIEPIDRSRT